MAIPAQISASRALAREERYAGDLEPAALQRLAEFAPQALHVDLRVYSDVGRQGWLEGQIGGRLRLECRVCSESFEWSLHAPVKLALAMSEEDEERLMDAGEPLWVRDDVIRLHEIVEDEVLLALPMMPRCAACENARPISEQPAPVAEVKPGALAALKGLSLKGSDAVRRK